MKRSREAEEEISRVALGIWFDQNFSPHSSRNPGTKIKRRRLREIANSFLGTLNLSPMTSRSPLWTQWFMVRIQASSGLRLRDDRDLDNFEQVIQKLLKTVDLVDSTGFREILLKLLKTTREDRDSRRHQEDS